MPEQGLLWQSLWKSKRNTEGMVALNTERGLGSLSICQTFAVLVSFLFALLASIRNGPVGWVRERKSKDVYKFLIVEANIPFSSLGAHKVQHKLISSLAPTPGSFHSRSCRIRTVPALHNERGPATGQFSVQFPLSEDCGCDEWGKRKRFP